MTNITPDLLGHRATTEALIEREIEWATAYLDHVPTADRTKWETIIALVMGGAYELIYRHVTGKADPISPEQLIKTCVSLQMGYLGYETKTISTVLEGYPEDRYEKARLIAFLDERLFS